LIIPILIPTSNQRKEPKNKLCSFVSQTTTLSEVAAKTYLLSRDESRSRLTQNAEEIKLKKMGKGEN
jgi:hypothetical protein